MIITVDCLSGPSASVVSWMDHRSEMSRFVTGPEMSSGHGLRPCGSWSPCSYRLVS